MSASASVPVQKRRVGDHPVIPDDDGALGPAQAHLEVGAVGDVVVEEFEQRIRLFLLVSDNVAGDCCGVSGGSFVRGGCESAVAAPR